MLENLVATLKANPRKIVFTEGSDARILEATDRLKKDGFLTPVLVGNVEEVKAAAQAGGFDIEGLEILDPLTYPEMDAMVDECCTAQGQDEPRRLPQGAVQGQLLRHHAGKDGQGRRSAGRRNLLDRRYRSSRTAAHQDQAGCTSGILLLYSGP